ncbi:MAG: hypothetical protein ACTHKC_06180 [Candidatus Nitrosocosmicus sp.]
MNFNTHKTVILLKTCNFKILFMGILLLTATTFSLMVDNKNVKVFAQGSNNPFIGCAHTVLMTPSGLSNQTSDSSTCDHFSSLPHQNFSKLP